MVLNTRSCNLLTMASKSSPRAAMAAVVYQYARAEAAVNGRVERCAGMGGRVGFEDRYNQQQQ